MQIAGLFIVLALACSAYAQFLPTNATLLTVNTPFSSVLPIQTSGYGAIPLLYYIYIPEETSQINIYLSQPSTSNCSYTDLYASAEGFVCNSNKPFDTSATYVCYGTSNLLETSTSTLNSNSSAIFPGSTSGTYGRDGYYFTSGGYMYFAVNRYYSSQFTTFCPFTITVNTGSCPAGNGSIAVGRGSLSSTTCNTYTVVALNSSVAISGNGTGNSVYKVIVPPNTASIMITVQSATSNVYAYGNPRFASPGTGQVGCSTSTSSSSNGTTTCYEMTTGSFFIVVSSSSAFNGTLYVNAEVCTGGALGPFCNSTIFDATAALTVGTINFVIPPSTTYYGMFTPTAATAGSFIYAKFSSNTSSTYLYYLRNGFPSTSRTSISSGSTIAFTPFDTLNLGLPFPTYYFAAQCYSSSYACNVTFGTNGTQVATTAAAATTASATTASATTAAAATTAGATTAGTTTAATTAARVTTAATSAARVTTSTVTTSPAFFVIPSLMLAIFALLF